MSRSPQERQEVEKERHTVPHPSDEAAGPAAQPPPSAPPGPAAAKDWMSDVTYAHQGLGKSSDTEEFSAEPTRLDSIESLADQVTTLFDSAPPHPTLKVLAGRELGAEFLLQSGDTSLGRGVDNDIILRDTTVSRHHLRIRRAEAGIEVWDLDSGNGTYVNGHRIQHSKVRHGDRLRVGETVMLVRTPELAVAQEGVLGLRPSIAAPEDTGRAVAPEAMLARSSPEALRSRSKSPIEERLSTVESRPVTLAPIALDESRDQWTMSTKVLLIAFGVVAFVVAIVSAGGTAWMMSARKPQFKVESTAADRRFESAVSAFNAARWDEAERDFRKLLAARPDDPEVQRYLTTIRGAREHERRLELSRMALARGDSLEALERASSIPKSSPLATEAVALERAALAGYVNELVREAEAALKQGKEQIAKDQLLAALQLDPKHELARKLATRFPDIELDRPPSAPAVEDASKGQPAAEDKSSALEAPAPIEPPAESTAEEQAASEAGDEGELPEASKALAAYKKGNFREAMRLAQRAAAVTSVERYRRKLVELADRIERFAKAYRRIQQVAPDYAPVSELMMLAMNLDLRISGGYYTKALQAPLRDVHLNAARASWRQGDASAACEHLLRALRVDASFPEVRKMAATCERHAAQMMDRAKQLESSDAAQARAFYREVLSIVPGGSRYHREASRRLQSLGRHGLVPSSP